MVTALLQTQLGRIACVATSGALGAVCRWGTTVATQRLLGTYWPYGTLTVNVLGCFLFGFAYQWFVQSALPVDSELRLLIFTGFLGAFTTFSTFGFETYELHHGLGIAWAVLNVALHISLGLTAVVVGVSLSRFL